ARRVEQRKADRVGIVARRVVGQVGREDDVGGGAIVVLAPRDRGRCRPLELEVVGRRDRALGIEPQGRAVGRGGRQRVALGLWLVGALAAFGALGALGALAAFGAALAAAIAAAAAARAVRARIAPAVWVAAGLAARGPMRRRWPRGRWLGAALA